jgi:cytochrome c-type biogenesis protein CcmH/NrfG
MGLARVLLDANKANLATDDLNELRKLDPDNPQVLALAARHARDMGLTSEAEDLAERAIAADPRSFDALLVRARLRFLSRRTKDAIADLRKAVEVKPNDVPTLQLLLQAERSQGMTKEADMTQELADRARQRIVLMDSLTKAINAHPEDPKPRWQMGMAAMDGELYTLAYQCFQAALDLDPSYQPAREGLKILRSTKGFDYQAATRSELQASGKPPAESP